MALTMPGFYKMENGFWMIEVTAVPVDMVRSSKILSR